MATKTTTPTATAQALRTAIGDMDALSQEGFSEIAAIASLTLRSMEHPDAYEHMDDIALALRAICGKAQSIMDSINCRAEELEANHVDDAERRRSAARRVAMDRRREAEIQEAAAARAGKESAPA